MIVRTTSAPGKLVLVGEYAVLLGHPAIVAAVDRRAICTREPAAVLTLSGQDGEPYEASIEEARVRFPDDARDELKLLRLVVDHARARGVPLPDAHLAVLTTAFLDGTTGEKLGLGSSAAAAVALAAQLCAGDDGAMPLDLVHEISQAAHRAFSAGRGSGVDVAASTYGGVLRFQRGAAIPAAPLPAGVGIVAVSAGAPQDTRDFVASFLARPDRISLAQPITDAVDAFTSARTAAELYAAVDAARAGMQRLGDRSGIDVVSAPHARIAEVAARHGGAAKPSGAGGGDLAVCFVDEEARDLLALAMEAAGLRTVELNYGVPGVTRAAPACS